MSWPSKSPWLGLHTNQEGMGGKVPQAVQHWPVVLTKEGWRAPSRAHGGRLSPNQLVPLGHLPKELHQSIHVLLHFAQIFTFLALCTLSG